MLGNFLNGIGGTTLYTLGIVYIDANVNKKDSSLYQGKLDYIVWNRMGNTSCQFIYIMYMQPKTA